MPQVIGQVKSFDVLWYAPFCASGLLRLEQFVAVMQLLMKGHIIDEVAFAMQAIHAFKQMGKSIISF